MTTVIIPTEQDIKRWIKEAVQEAFELRTKVPAIDENAQEPLLNRKEVAALFRVSLVTLHSWMNKGLPFHKQGGRVYFRKSDVMSHLEYNSQSTTKQDRLAKSNSKSRGNLVH